MLVALIINATLCGSSFLEDLYLPGHVVSLSLQSQNLQIIKKMDGKGISASKFIFLHK